jgi:hypothetical protein
MQAHKTCPDLLNLEAPGRVELPTNGLGNRCSIHLSYGATWLYLLDFTILLHFHICRYNRIQSTS